MAWPSETMADNVDVVAAAHINSIVKAVKKWEGDVDANGHALSKLTAIGITTPGGAAVAISGVAGSDRFIQYQTNGVIRWNFGAGSDAESGSNAGSNLALHRYSDAGAWLGQVITINRNDGRVTLGNHLTVTNSLTCSVVNATASNFESINILTPNLDAAIAIGEAGGANNYASLIWDRAGNWLRFYYAGVGDLMKLTSIGVQMIFGGGTYTLSRDANGFVKAP